MNSKNHDKFSWLGFLLVVSCGPNKDVGESDGNQRNEQLKQPVVVNGFDGDNSCELRSNVFDALNGNSSLNQGEILREYRLKMLTHSSVKLFSPSLPSGSDCSDSDLEKKATRSLSSGQGGGTP